MHNRASKTLNAFAGVALAAAVMTPQAGFAAGVCADHSDRAGLEMRVLQSELMVAALTCGQRSEYNSFISTFKPQIKKHGSSLKTFFQKAYGSGATVKLNKLVTRLANQASQRTLTQPTSAYCAEAKERFTRVLAARPDQLLQLARTSPTAGDHGFRSCVEVVQKKAEDDLAVSTTN